MNHSNYTDILEALQTQIGISFPELGDYVRERSFRDRIEKDDYNPQLAEFLGMVIGAILEQSTSSYSRSLDRIRKCVSTENGDPVDGIQLDISADPDSPELLNVVDMSGGAALARLIDDLQEIQQAILSNWSDNH